VGIVSNWDSRLISICEGLGVDEHVDFILPSAVAGYRKPSSNIFEQALETAEVAPDEAMHIGDKELDDYRGSRSAGLTPVLLDRNDQHTEQDRNIISSLDQVTRLLNTQKIDLT
jgi:putative hydrolase of the HAD superfamily